MAVIGQEPEDYRVRGFKHPVWQDNRRLVKTCKAVPHAVLAVVVRSLFHDGAVKVVVEDEKPIAQLEQEEAIEDGTLCPTTLKENCGACSGEACFLCGAGCWDASVRNCEHDVIERHQEKP